MSDKNVMCGSNDSGEGGYSSSTTRECNSGEAGRNINTSAQQEDSVKMKRPEELTVQIVKRQKTDEQNFSNVPELTNKLPNELLVLLFSWLSMWDLISVKRVCHKWREAAQDISLWKNHVLTVFGGNRKDEISLKLMPDVKNIDGWASNSVLNVILENITDLSKLNVEFKPPLSTSQVMQVLEKYSKLESISLCSCKPNILEILEKLKTSQYLKKIIFFYICDRPFKGCTSLSVINIFKMFTDRNNFPALTDLDISSNLDFMYAFKNDVLFRALVADIIIERSQQLLSVTLNASTAGCSSVMNAINTCVKLQTLIIDVVPKNACINIENLSELRSLSLRAFGQDKSFNTTLQTSLEKGTWPHLTEIEITLGNINDECNVPVLKSVIDKAKQLKILRYTDFGYLITEQQLEGISSLTNLENLLVIGFKNISKLVIGYLSECHSLKRLELETRHSNISDKDPCITEMLLQLAGLNYLSIKVDGDDENNDDDDENDDDFDDNYNDDDDDHDHDDDDGGGCLQGSKQAFFILENREKIERRTCQEHQIIPLNICA